MDLVSYADLAVDLVNTQRAGQDDLHDLDGLRALLARRPQFGGRTARRDLDAMRDLRAQLRAIVTAAARGDGAAAVDLLNTLIMQHPIHPQVTRHDGQDWHLHFNEAGSIPDRYAARSAMGLAAVFASRGPGRLRFCRADGCERVFLDTTANGARRHCSERCAGRSGAPAAGLPGRPKLTAWRPVGTRAARDGGQ